MSKEKEPERALTPIPPRELALGPNAKLDISKLPEATQQELMKQQAEGFIGLQKKAIEAGMDVQALKGSLDTLTETTKDITAAGASITAEHRVKSTVGETHVKVGNTPSARWGCLVIIGLFTTAGVVLRWLLS